MHAQNIFIARHRGLQKIPGRSYALLQQSFRNQAKLLRRKNMRPNI
jgi:hypothetical protein